MPNLLKLKDDFSEKGILISFNGPFTHSIIEEIGNAIKHHLEGQKLTKGTITDVFAVYVEQTQNCRNYLSRKDFESNIDNSAIVVIMNNNGYYTVCSGNTIRKADVPALKEHIDLINSNDKEGLRKLYKQQIRKELPPNSTGAGLGLMDMAKRASEKLRYRFEEKDGEYDFFSLFVTVKGI
ncbi:MAG: SiaB family protein kinase [Sedimentisphaeraceae bacterium JB056]